MLIDVEKIVHTGHSHCVRLNWNEDCFLRIYERSDSSQTETYTEGEGFLAEWQAGPLPGEWRQRC